CDARKIGRKQPEPYAGTYAMDRGACFGLQFRRQTRTHFYLFSQSADGGLLRLYPTGCDRQRPDFSATAISYPLQGQAFGWNPRGGQQSLHVIVTATDSATRRLDRLMSLLPDSCARSSDRSKDRNISSNAWLSSMETSIEQMGSAAAWQSLDVLHASNFRGARR
ncbi:MAG: hypothetical protein KJP03_00570, partial [Gammaproteobacteria bacterium]|nr:hypothetical protein [Gammaproteobacteria bacterium]